MSPYTVIKAEFALCLGVGQQPVMQHISLEFSPTRKVRQLAFPLPNKYGSVIPGDDVKDWSIKQTDCGDLCILELRKFVRPGKRMTVSCGLLFRDEWGPRLQMLVYKPPSPTTVVDLEVSFLARHQPGVAHAVVWGGQEPTPDKMVFTHRLELERLEPDDAGQVFWVTGLYTTGVPPNHLLGIVW